MKKHLFLIRHNKTARKQGEIVKNYADSDILVFDKNEWYNKTKSLLDIKSDDNTIYSSPVKRCKQTALMLTFSKLNANQYVCLNSLKEFEMPPLDKPFTQCTKEEFEAKVKITPAEMKQQALQFLQYILYLDAKNIVAVSHGTFICYLQWLLRGNPDISLYDVITSKEIDMMPLDTVELVIEGDSVFNLKLLETKKCKFYE